MKKTITKLSLVFFLMIIYAYTLAIESIPSHLVILEGEKIALKTLLGMAIKTDAETMETHSRSQTIHQWCISSWHVRNRRN